MMRLPMDTYAPPSLTDYLTSREFDVERPPAKPHPVFSLGDHVICTAGNLTNIQALPKVGKSAVIGAMLAAAIGPNSGGDTLGFSAHNTGGKALIHFDTEQTPHDHHQLVRRGMQRVKVDVKPPWFHSYCITDLPIDAKLAALEQALDMHSKAHGGVFAVLIDGVADLCASPNDDVEAFALVARLHEMAIRFGCPIVTVLHENPGGVPGKTRGHLGSQLERKAETNLRLAKDAKGVTTVWTERARHCHVPKDQGYCFEWSVEHAMHVSSSGASEARKASERDSMRVDVDLVFEGATDLSYGQLVGVIGQALELKIRAAKNRVKQWQQKGVIQKRTDGRYEKAR